MQIPGYLFQYVFVEISPNSITTNQISIQFYNFINVKNFLDSDILSFSTNQMLASGTYIIQVLYNETKFNTKMIAL